MISKKQFSEFILNELSKEQLAILSFAFMYNPEHIDYYIAFKTEDFDSCKQYVIDNKNEITIDNIPEHLKTAADYSLKIFNTMSDERVREVYLQ